MKPSDAFKFRKLNWQDYFRSYTTPRDWKKGARDIPFGQGAKSLYVDGTNGHDHNDGESWKTAFKTIQAAVDAAGSWAQIFIKAATYAENVIISKNHIKLVGESRNTTFIAPGSGHGLYVTADNFSAENLYCKTFSGTARGALTLEDGDFALIRNCKAGVTQTGGRGFYFKNYNHILLELSVSEIDGDALALFLISSEYNRIFNNIFSNPSSSAVRLAPSSNSIVYENIIRNSYRGITLSGPSTGNTIFHNNFSANSFHMYDGSSGANAFFENFFDNHSNIDNGFGIATEPFSFTGGYDSRPVVFRNGWHSVSIQRSLLRKRIGAQATQAATDANGTTWVDLKTITPTTSDFELYRIQMTVAGTWVGTARYRIIVGSTKIYPFAADAVISSGILVTFLFSINVQINETVKIQFRSDDAGDGVGETVALDQLDYAQVL